MYKNSKVAVIIAAAGQGKRLGAPVPKQYLKIGGEYVIAKTIKAFEDIDEVDYIFVVTNSEYRQMCADIVEERGFSKVEGIVAGGSRRQDSVFNALQEINARKPGVSMVLIHDGARPFIGKDVILNVLEETELKGAAVACVAMKNSVRRMEQGSSASTSVDRADYYSVQTPQGFRKSMLIEAYDKAFDEGFSGTDDASIIEWAGYDISIVDGDYGNDTKLAVQLFQAAAGLKVDGFAGAETQNYLFSDVAPYNAGNVVAGEATAAPVTEAPSGVDQPFGGS